MTRKEIFEWVRKQYGTEPDYPWRDRNAVLRHKENKKWYGLIMEVKEEKLGLAGDAEVDVLNVKCDPILIGSLRTQPGFLPAYHMNKDRWISVLLEESASDDEIKHLIDLSFQMTAPKKLQ